MAIIAAHLSSPALLAVRTGALSRSLGRPSSAALKMTGQTKRAACRSEVRAAASSSDSDLKLSTGCQGAPLEPGTKLPIPGGEELMSQKGHGTTEKPVQSSLRWGCDQKVADKICSFNRHYAEFGGYWQTTSFLQEVDTGSTTVFYDSVTGLPLFEAPIGRTFEDFKKESQSHGWPSFRDEEVNWDYVRVLSDGEAVSTAGTHLGHNLPDGKGNRYCINLVSVAGKPE